MIEKWLDIYGFIAEIAHFSTYKILPDVNYTI